MEFLLEYTVTVINLLLCLSYKLNFTIGLHGSVAKFHDKVLCCLRAEVSTECPGLQDIRSQLNAR